MERTTGKKSIFRTLDWWTIAIYLTLLIFGWISVCGASYNYGDEELFGLGSRSGMQIVWIATSLCIGIVILMLDEKVYETYGPPLYCLMLLLLFATIFNPHQIKGSRSWLVLGPLRLQPAEFAKFATALALAKYMSSYGYSVRNIRHFLTTLAIIALPMLFIVMQRETGSALVYSAFFLMLYREGMPGSVLFSGVAAVTYFVVGIRFADTPLPYTASSLGRFAVFTLIQLYTIALLRFAANERITARRLLIWTGTANAIALLFSVFTIPFDVVWAQGLVIAGIAIYLLVRWLHTRFTHYVLLAGFVAGSLAFYFSADYMLNHVMEPHQRVRINVLLGLEEDLSGAGYNVHQSEIAIGSGGLQGKGFLNGTQTKLNFVPEQDTDFIFCTVGEEEGFVGAAGVLLLFLALILRLIHLAERQTLRFSRVYGYCVLSIFLFHLFINIGMVLGLTPVIGIPLPFFSYGGSSLWGFTFLLFIFLKIDAERERK